VGHALRQEAYLKRHSVLLAVISLVGFFLLVFALHYPGLCAPMVYDTFGRLIAKEHLFANHQIVDVIRLEPQRPVPMATFYFNYLLGGMDARYFRVFNLLLIAMAALIVGIVIGIVLEQQSPRIGLSSEEKVALSLGASLLFLVHPLQTYVGLYIWQRLAIMVCLFYYGSLAAFLATRAGMIHDTRLGYGLCLVLFLLAALSKENAVTLPAVLILADIALFKETWTNVIKRACAYTVAVAAALCLIAGLASYHWEGPEAVGLLSRMEIFYSEAGYTISEVLLAQCRVLFYYVAAVAIPLPSIVQFCRPMTVPYSIMDPPSTLPAAIGAVALLGSGILLIKKRPVAGLGILFFVVNLLPESLLVPQYLYLGYRAVLPMLGGLLVLTDILAGVLTWSRSHGNEAWVRRGIVVLFVSALVYLSGVTILKANTWSNPVAFWMEIVEKFPPPGSRVDTLIEVNVLNNAGWSLREERRFAEAIPFHERAYRIRPGLPYALLALGEVYDQLGKPETAAMYFEQVTKSHPNNARAHAALATVLVKMGKGHEALDHAKTAANIDWNDPWYQVVIGCSLQANNDDQGAISFLRQAVARAPYMAAAYYYLGWSLLKAGHLEESMVHSGKTLDLDPRYWQAHNNLGVALAQSGRLNEAVAHFQAALKINPSGEDTRRNLETALQQIRDAQAQPAR